MFLHIMCDVADNKKKGRKPKGGKMTAKLAEPVAAVAIKPNVILHLKCSSADLQAAVLSSDLVYTPNIPPDIQTYNGLNNTFSEYEKTENTTDYAYTERVRYCQTTDDTETKDINAKLRSLKINLYKNTLQDKKSACFWCTYEFDNPACYIPRYEMGGKIFGYGSFCRPECAVAFLMKEGIDDSTKFERYHLLNQLYSKVYDYKKSIKPAPDPHYLLDKFFGTLTIQEYRRLLKSQHLLMVLDKPMTRVMPEIFEDTDQFITGIYGDANTTVANTTMYKVKRQSEKKSCDKTKTNLRDKFGM